jgi:DNA-binding NarL/FixJ family response regulator
LHVGSTLLTFRRLTPESKTSETMRGTPPPKLTPTEQEVLTELCRPWWDEGYITSNPDIGKKVHLSEETVKGHLRTLFRKFGIKGKQGEKRSKLVRHVIDKGLIGRPDQP